ncbi:MULTISPECIES: NAD(P)/FAD-dependent oxidoreductase [unclassified Frondihabitans]|uniref:protoporphyrinogen/coproporphyrinogen oxidase n=1 Tax=unclassified Frondihabitans TaxID=2626248 RepID=UPI000F4DF459|nr:MULTISPECIES: FAD-dependent oxidoreductase [unclassified Frondihabitans]RPE77719.1 oxygen-dependent protoporphyrinogen oxidase [Frondihabitans sp. PhB153]RPF07997.1 oxygen-dependent protoporphyrinogen oxidase [Frondihabitans sp. PhB161]
MTAGSPFRPDVGEHATAVVVGGGVAGLVVARDLGKAGRRVTLLEASARLGGEVQRHSVAGIDLDSGAESFATKTDAIQTLATQLGLGNEIVNPDPRGAWVIQPDGTAFELPKTGLLGIPGTPMAKDVIDVIGTGAALRAEMDSLLPGPVGAKEQKLGPLVRRRMGRAVLDKLVTPVVQGVHSAHPDDLDVDRVAPGLRQALLHENSLARAVRALREASPAGSAVGGIRGGIVRLVDELAADLEMYGVEVRFGARVTAYEAHSVTLDTGEQLAADTVVVALGGRDAARLDGALDDGTSQGSTGSASETGLITLATLVVRDPALDAAPRGTGVLVAPGAPGIRAKALTHATVKWDWVAERAGGRHVLRLSYSAPAVGRATADDELRSLAIDDASRILGMSVDPASVEGFARVEWDGPYRGAGSAGREVPGVVRVGGAVAGRGLAGVVADARLKVAEILSPEV